MRESIPFLLKMDYFSQSFSFNLSYYLKSIIAKDRSIGLHLAPCMIGVATGLERWRRYLWSWFYGLLRRRYRSDNLWLRLISRSLEVIEHFTLYLDHLSHLFMRKSSFLSAQFYYFLQFIYYLLSPVLLPRLMMNNRSQWSRFSIVCSIVLSRMLIVRIYPLDLMSFR